MPTPTNPDDILLIDNQQIAQQIELIFIEEKSANKSPNYPEVEQLDTLKSALIDLIIYLNGIISHDQLDFDNLINDKLLEALPTFQPKIYDLNKKILNTYPPLMRLIVLLHYLEFLQANERNKLKKKWVLIGLLIAIRLKVLGLNSYYKTLILRIKLAIFSKSPTYAWIWQALESEELQEIKIDKDTDQEALSFIQIFTQKLHELADKHFEQMEIIGQAKIGEKQAKQLDTIAKSIEQGFYKSQRQRAKIEANDKKREKRREEKIQQDKNLRKKNKIPSQSAQILAKPVFHQPVESNYTWDKPKYIKDIEAFTLPLQYQYILPSFGSETQPTSFEEKIDNVERLINYTKPPSPSIKYSVPLQTVELSLQQVYISRRDFRLNSDTRLLSQYAYQQVFARLVADATSTDANTVDWHKKSASLLLLSFITALPVKTLTQPHFIATCSLFIIQKTQAFIQHELGITKRKNRSTHLVFENDSDKVTLPLPVKLLHYLSKSNNLPNIDTDKKSATNELADYLSLLRAELELPYLSINRIETALETILTRYTKGSHSHIAELICRTPASDAPATFYSSHTNSEIVTHYVQSLNWLNIHNRLPLNYFTRRQDEKVGSGSTLTLETVHELLSKLKVWIVESDSLQVLFNRCSAYMWLVLCLLTGIRPNNGLGKVQDIDLDMGWLLIDDKPNKSVKNHRLIPLCQTLITHLTTYQQLLAKLRLSQLHRPAINQILFNIKTETTDIPLLNLLSDNFEKMLAIKRGDILYQTQEI